MPTTAGNEPAMSPDERIAAARRELAAVLAEQQSLLKTDRSRRRGAINRRIHELHHMLAQDFPYVSQAGQDVVVDRLFGGKRDGTFVDIGGYDGSTGSNTLFLELWRGWSGVLVEPVPAQLTRARALRRCPCIGVAVSDREGEAEFIEITEGYTQMSGLSASYDPGLLTRVRSDPRHRERRIPVALRTISAILTEAGIPDPDFVSLDIEGGEARALSAFPFDRHRVGVWAVENNTAASDIGEIMQPAGYDLVEFCGPDEIWRLRGL